VANKSKRPHSDINKCPYPQFKVQIDVLLLFIHSSYFFLALHVSGVICTHPQEHNCNVQPQVCMVPHNFSTVNLRQFQTEIHRAKSVRVSQTVPGPMD
jgi:hypothetical protein